MRRAKVIWRSASFASTARSIAALSYGSSRCGNGARIDVRRAVRDLRAQHECGRVFRWKRLSRRLIGDSVTGVTRRPLSSQPSLTCVSIPRERSALRGKVFSCTDIRTGWIMETLSYTAIRNCLARALDQVNDDRTAIIITRQKGRPAVLMSLEEYRSWEETLHLMRSPANAARLDRAIGQLQEGKGKRLPLLEAHRSGPTRRAKTISGGRAGTKRPLRASTR